MKTVVILIGLLALLGVAGMAAFVFVIQNVEQPPYRALAQDGDFEVREYPPLVVAEVRRQGGRRQALSSGFGPLAGYIFAKERTGERIAMTAPVTQTADAGEWAVRFFMPAGYDLDRLPAPAGSDVRLRELPRRTVAALRFSGGTSDERIAEKESELRAWVTARGLTPASAPLYGYYNDPLTPGFLRRNEVMIEVGDGAALRDAAPSP